MNKIILIIVLGCSIQISFGQSGWVLQNPYPTSSPISYVKMFNSSSGVFIDDIGNILKTTNTGDNWNQIFSTTDFAHKYSSSLFMLDASNGYLCLDSTNMIRTVNGGFNWVYTSQFGTINSPKAVFINSNTGFVYGYYEAGNISLVKRTSDAGANWISVISDNTFKIKSMCFPSDQIGYAAGYNAETGHMKLFRTSNYGLMWDSIHTDFEYLFVDLVHFINNTTGFLCAFAGVNYFYRTTNSGTSWQPVTGSDLPGIVDMKFADQNTGYFNRSGIYKSTDSGLNWSMLDLGGVNGSSAIRAFDFPDVNNCFIFGDGGLIARSPNGGANWTKLNKNVCDQYLWDIKFINSLTGLTVSDYGKIIQTTDGGANWVLHQMYAGNAPISISMPSQNVWYVADNGPDHVYKTTNAGVSWETTHTHRQSMTMVDFVNENTGFVICKYYYFIKTTDGGNTWKDTNLQISQNWAMDFVDANTGIIGSSARTVRTTDGGVTWQTVGNTNWGFSYCVQFASHNIVFASDGRLYKSTDAGINWQLLNFSDQGNTINNICFINADSGYVVGDALYRTTNSGASFDSIGMKAIEHTYCFTDMNTGYGVGYGGRIVKTTTGGIPPIITPPEIPIEFSISQNYPNPFNPNTSIRVKVPNDFNTKIEILIYDILGRRVTELWNDFLSPGIHDLVWHASEYSSGVYFYLARAGDFVQSKKMILLK